MNKLSTISKKKSYIFSCFGIAVGLCLGTVIKNYRALQVVQICGVKVHNFATNAFDIIGLSNDGTIYNSQNNFVFVGVMTAKNFLDGRAKAVYDTWGKDVPGKIAFFSSEISKSSSIPLISLKNVDDRYPPQKKSFMMLYYMYEYFVDKFEWFIRADDDVYIDPVNLEKFLRSIDSSKPQFIGQAGKGNSEEFGLLSLEFDENFCMGGPGVIFSRETLRRVAPHIPACLKNLYSSHEDVEIGRCVQRYAGIPCTWNYEMQYIMKHNSSGKTAFTGKFKRKDVNNAISLHPVKQAPLMYRLHTYIKSLKSEDIRQQSLYLHRDINRMTKLLYPNVNNDFFFISNLFLYKGFIGDEHFEDHTILGFTPEMNKFFPKNIEGILKWDFIAKSWYSEQSSNPKHKINSAKKYSLENSIQEVMDQINDFSRQRGRIIEFRELLYGYSRLNHKHGHDFILDLLLIYKKYRGKKMTVPVRRHLYVQRSFNGVFVKEFDGDFYNLTILDSENQKSNFSADLKNLLKRNFQKFSTSLSFPVIELKSYLQSKIVFVLPIMHRMESYKMFLSNYEKVAIKSDKNCNLLIVMFGTYTDVYKHTQILLDLQRKFPFEEINYIHINQNFSRGLALDKAVRTSYIKNEQIVFFIDVDMIFLQESLDRIRINTIQGKQVYFPIVFSEFEKKNTFQNANNLITNKKGFFRQFGFGLCSIYKSDISKPEINGFDVDIKGWGLEDVKFLEKIIANSNKHLSYMENTAEAPRNSNFQNRNMHRALQIFRTIDPSLIHLHHLIDCNISLEPIQYNMCLGTKANTLGDWNFIENIFLNNQQTLDSIKNITEQYEKQM